MLTSSFAARFILGVLSVGSMATVVKGEIKGTAVTVSTNSEGLTHVTVSKPTINESQIMTYFASMNPFYNGRSISFPTSSSFKTNVATDMVVLVAPSTWDGTDSVGEEDRYVAYVLPKGLSSLPDVLKTRILSTVEGVKKIGLFVLPPDITGTTGATVPDGLFPMKCMNIKEFKLVDGDVKAIKVDLFMDAFGYPRLNKEDTPWLILREVKEKIEGKDAHVMKTRSVADTVAPEVEPTDKPVLAEFGTITLGSDGKVNWTNIPVPPIPVIPPIPLIPPPPLPPFPELPFYPFFYPNSLFNPNPFWFLNPPPFYWPVPSH